MDDVSYTQNGQQITISIDALIDTDVFLISENDMLPPGQVENLRLAPRDPTDPNYVPAPANRQLLSWDEPFDNFGILGYEVFQDDTLLGTVPTPAFEIFDLQRGSRLTRCGHSMPRRIWGPSAPFSTQPPPSGMATIPCRVCLAMAHPGEIRTTGLGMAWPMRALVPAIVLSSLADRVNPRLICRATASSARYRSNQATRCRITAYRSTWAKYPSRQDSRPPSARG